MFSYLYSVVFTLIPALYIRQLPVPFEGAKANLIYAFTFLLLISVAVKTPGGIGKIFKKYKYIFIFLLAAVFSSLINHNFSKSLWGNYYRFDGVFSLLNFVVFALLTTLLAKNLNIKIISRGVAIGAALSLAASFFVRGTTFGNVNLLAGYLAVSIAFVIFSIPNILKYLYLAVLAAFAVYISSKALLIAILIYVLLVAIYKLNKKYLIIALVITFIIMSVIYLFYIFSSPDILFIAESRERITRRLLYAFSVKPLFGWGWANVDIAIRSAVWPIKVYKDIYIDKAHGIILEVLVTTGVVGLFTYLNMLRDLFTKIINAKRNNVNFVLLATLTLFVVHSQLNIISLAEELLFWFTAGLLLAGFQKLNGKE